MGRGKSSHILRLIEAAYRILEEIQPASVRAVCYRLFVEGLIDSMSKSNTNRVSTQLVWAREQGEIPWEWIVDETRKVEGDPGFSNPKEFMEVALLGFRRDHWDYQSVRVEVWSEKGTIRGTLRPVLDEFGVPFRVMHGYSSATTVREIAEESSFSGKPLVAFYVGDWDPSGLHMSQVDLPRRLREYGAHEEKVGVYRIALSHEDVGPDLPSFDVMTKKADPRWRWYVNTFKTDRAWELDALNPNILRDRVRKMIEGEIDKEAWERCTLAEQAEQRSLNEVLYLWAGQ